MSDELRTLDEVSTPEGGGVVMGTLDDGQVEVRYPSQGRRLKIWPRDMIAKTGETPVNDGVEIATPDAAEAYRQARERGENPTVPAEAFASEQGDDTPVQPQRSTLARMVEDNTPRSKSGKPLTGAALAKARAKQQREQG